MRILIRDLSPDTVYNYQLRSVSSDAKSEWSQLFTIQTVKKSAFPADVTGLVWNTSGRAFTATWNPVTTNSDGSTINDLKDYQVTIYSPLLPATKIVYYTTEPRFDLSYEANVAAFGVPRGSITIEVVARDSWKNISITPAVATATNPAPATPTGLAGTAVYDAIELKWNANTEDDLLGYEVYYNNTNSGTGTLVYSGPANSYTHLTVSATPHYFYVVAFDVFSTRSIASSYIGPFTPKSSITVDTTAPAAISGVTAANTPTTDGPAITVTWNKNTADSDFDSYTVRYSTSSTGPYEYMQVPQPASGTTVSAIIKGLVPGASYYISVQGADFTANKNGFTNATPYPQTASGNTNAPAAPTGVASFEGFNALTVYWVENTEADVKWGAGTYEVQVDTSGAFNTANLKTLVVASPAANFTGLISNSTYNIRVRARNSSGTYGAYSTTITNAIGQPADDIPTNTLGMDRIKANDVLTSSLTLQNDVPNGRFGQIATTDYVAGTSGFRLRYDGLDLQSGTVAARTLQIQDSANIMPTAYADFEFRTDYYTGKMAGTATGVAITATNAKFNTQALQFVSNGTLYLSPTTTTYNIVLDQPATYIVSYYAAVSTGVATITPTLTTNAGNALAGSGVTLNGTMTRYSFVANVPAGATTSGVLWFSGTGSGTVQIDGVQIEKQIGALTTPSQFKPPSFTSIDGGVIRTGEIRSIAVSPIDSSQPAWSINTQGGAQLNDVSVRGKIVVGQVGNAAGLNNQIAIASSNYGGSGAQWSIFGDGTFNIKTGTGAGVTLAGTGLTGNDGSGTVYLSGRPAGETFYLSNSGTLMLSGTLTGSNIYGSVFATTSDTSLNAIRIGPSESFYGTAGVPAITFGAANTTQRPFIQYDSTTQDLTIGNQSSTYYSVLRVIKNGGFTFGGLDPDLYAGETSFGKLTGRGLNFRGSFESGTQNSTYYYRTGNSFGWYLNGSYSPNYLDPGTGGTLLMKLDNAGNLTVPGTITFSGAAGGTGGALRPDSEYLHTTNDTQNVAGIKTFTGTLRLTGAALDVSNLSGTTVAGSGTTGDKVALYNSGSAGYGIGIQANKLVNYLPVGASFVVTQASATGNASSGASVFSVSYGGAVNSTGNITENGVRVYSASNPQPITYPVTSVSGSGSGITVSPTTGAVVVSNTGVLTVTASGNMASSGGQNPAITISATPTFTSATVPTLTGTVNTTGNLSENGSRVYGPNNANLSSATPVAIAGTGTAGVGTAYARDTHTHAGVTSIQMVNNATPTIATNGVVTITNSLTPVLTSATIPTLTGAVNTTGNLSENSARVYSANNANLAVAVVSETAFGQAAAVGVGTDYAHGNHTHGTPATPVTTFTSNTGLSSNVSATGAVTVTNTGVLTNVAGTGIGVSGATGNVTITNNGVTNLSLGGTTANFTISAATGAVQLSMAPSPTFTGLTVNALSTLTNLNVKGTTNIQTSGGVTLFTFDTVTTTVDGTGVLTTPNGAINGTSITTGTLAYNKLSGAAQAVVQAFSNSDNQYSFLRRVTVAQGTTDSNTGLPIDGFVASNGATRVVDASAYAGYKLTNTGMTTNVLAVTGPAVTTLQPGQYQATYFVKANTFPASTSVMSLQVTGTAVTANPVVTLNATDLSSTYVGFVVPFTITAATNSVNTTVTSNVLPGTVTWSLSHVRVNAFDGSVAAGATTYFFANAAITSAQIQSITAAQITTATMTADITQAGTIRTGPTTGSRVELTSSGIYSYLGSGTGTPIVQITNSGGFQMQSALSGARINMSSSTGLQIYSASATVFNADLSGNLSLIGNITATSGYIGTQAAGWSIGSSTITSQGGTTMQLNSATGQILSGSGSSFISMQAGVGFWAGNTTFGPSAPFRVDTAGNLTATSANVTGTINATSGYIGTSSNGWTIQSDMIYSPSNSGAGSMRLVNKSGGGPFIQLFGDNTAQYLLLDARPNNVSNPYSFYATDSTGSPVVSISRNGNAFFKGQINATSGNFTGNITSSATITGGTVQTSDATVQLNSVGFQIIAKASTNLVVNPSEPVPSNTSILYAQQFYYPAYGAYALAKSIGVSGNGSGGDQYTFNNIGTTVNGTWYASVFVYCQTAITVPGPALQGAGGYFAASSTNIPARRWTRIRWSGTGTVDHFVLRGVTSGELIYYGGFQVETGTWTAYNDTYEAGVTSGNVRTSDVVTQQFSSVDGYILSGMVSAKKFSADTISGNEVYGSFIKTLDTSGATAAMQGGSSPVIYIQPSTSSSYAGIEYESHSSTQTGIGLYGGYWSGQTRPRMVISTTNTGSDSIDFRTSSVTMSSKTAFGSGGSLTVYGPIYATGVMAFNNSISGNGKIVASTADGYLRINESVQFGSGIWIGGSPIRGGNGGAYFGSIGGDGEVAILAGTSASRRITLDGTNGNITYTGILNTSSAGIKLNGQPGVTITENYGMILGGAGIQPVQVQNATLLVGYGNQSGTDYGVGSIYATGYIYAHSTTNAYQLRIGEIVGFAGVYAPYAGMMFYTEGSNGWSWRNQNVEKMTVTSAGRLTLVGTNIDLVGGTGSGTFQGTLTAVGNIASLSQIQGATASITGAATVGGDITMNGTRLRLNNQTVAGTANAQFGYLVVVINGTTLKIPVYNV